MAARVAALPDPRSGPAGVTPYKQCPQAAVVDFAKLPVPSAGKDSTLPLSPVAAGEANRTDHVGCRNGQRRGHGPGRPPPSPKRAPPQGARGCRRLWGASSDSLAMRGTEDWRPAEVDWEVGPRVRWLRRVSGCSQGPLAGWWFFELRQESPRTARLGGGPILWRVRPLCEARRERCPCASRLMGARDDAALQSSATPVSQCVPSDRRGCQCVRGISCLTLVVVALVGSPLAAAPLCPALQRARLRDRGSTDNE